MKKLVLQGKRNKGSTLIIVLVAMAFVGILATMVLTMAMSNFQMKKVDKGSKENFYSAEGALDELRTGLETDIAKVVESTYAEIMLEYASLPVGARGQEFKKKLGYKLSDEYDALGIVTSTNWTNISTKYDIDRLSKYLEDAKGKTTITAKDGQNTLECLFVNTDTTKQYICFRNLCIGYTESGTNLYTQITTDLKVSIPNANFEAISIRPTYTDYAIIANRQLLVDDGDSGKVEGSVYAGDYGIVTKLGAALQLNSNQIIVEGDIATIEGGNITIDDLSPMDGKEDSNIWAENITTKSASGTSAIAAYLTLTGNFYIANDVAINAPNSKITLNGSYYGYGFGSTPEKSSAMIINRRNSLLDLTNLKNVFIAGRAYIEPVQTTLENLSVTNDAVLTGEAISSKVNQLAYLLPGNCIGVTADGKAVGHNPLSLEEYQALKDAKDAGSSIKEVNVDYVIPFSGKKLSYYVNIDDAFVRIFDDTYTSGMMYYYYPKFKSEILANEYFRDYISQSDNLELLMKRLEGNESYIRLPDNIVNNSSSGRKTYAGNIVAYQDGATPDLYMYENSVDAELPMQFKRESDDLQNMYQAYKSKLVPSTALYSDEELLPDNLFDRLLLEHSGDTTCPGIYELVSGKPVGANHSVLFDDTSYQEYGKFILVTNSRSTAPDVFDSTNAFKVDESISPDVHIIIATGDVEVKSDFNGIIISKGIVKITNGAKVSANPKQVFDLICNSPVRTVFRDYNSFPFYLTNEKEEQIDISSLITEENWSKN